MCIRDRYCRATDCPHHVSHHVNHKLIFHPNLDPINQLLLRLHSCIIDISSLPRAHASIPTWSQRCFDSNSKVLNLGRKPPKKRVNENMKSIVTDRNVTRLNENEKCQVLSLVQSQLSNVEEALSDICTKMVCVNVKTRKKVLPYVSQILYLYPRVQQQPAPGHCHRPLVG